MDSDYPQAANEELVWYFTFGVGHPLKGKMQPIHGSRNQARQKMFAIYGHHWCSQLTGKEAAEQIAAYGYELLPEVE